MMVHSNQLPTFQAARLLFQTAFCPLQARTPSFIQPQVKTSSLRERRRLRWPERCTAGLQPTGYESLD